MTLDRVALMVKVGDNGQYLEGMPVDYIDERDWGRPLEEILSANCRRVFVPVLITRDILPKVREYLAPVGFEAELDEVGMPVPGTAYRLRSAILPLETLAPVVGEPDLVAKARSTKDVLPLLDGKDIREDMFVDSQTISPTRLIPDDNVIASGSYTVGAAKNYATWALFAADVTTQTGALTGTQETAITETAQAAFTHALAGNTLTLTSDTNPNGDFTAGHLTSYNSATQGAIAVTCTSAGAGAVVQLSNLNYKNLSTGLVMFDFRSNTTNITHKVNDCLVNGNATRIYGLYANAANCVVSIFNFKAANSTAAGAGAHTAGVLFFSAHVSSTLENCSFYDFQSTSTGKGTGFANYANAAFVVKNLASFGCEFDYTYSSSMTAGLGNAVASKCASSDTTGSEAGLRSLTAADQFRSLDITSALFMKLKSGGVLDTGGVAPSIAANTYGERGNSRPTGASTYSIGADQIGAVNVAYPNGAESVVVGDTITIQWTSDNIDGNVTIALTKNDADYTNIFTSTTDDDSQPWVVTSPPSTDCKIKITADNDTGLTDTSDVVFNIVAAPSGGGIGGGIGMGIGIGL